MKNKIQLVVRVLALFTEICSIFKKEEESIHMLFPRAGTGRRGQVSLREGVALGVVGRGRWKNWSRDID